MIFRTSTTLGAAGLVLATVLSGCAGFGDLQQALRRNSSDDIGQQRANRKDKLAQDFDRQRDDAQFDAAASSWERGDVEGARKILDQLLDRNPNHRRARLLLADLYLFNGNAERSMQELNKALAADPKDALAHHSLAQILDACGRRDEAVAHYKTATQLETSNQIYAQSYKMALDLAPAAPPREMLATTNPKADDRIIPSAVSIPTSPVVAAPLVRPADDNANRPQNNRLFAAGNVDEWVKPIDLATGGVSSGGPQNPPQIFNLPPSAVGANSAIVAAGRPENPSQV
jgi:tetratricopeptide (TPR) repeat protein